MTFSSSIFEKIQQQLPMKKKVVILLVLALALAFAAPTHAQLQLLPCPPECGKDKGNTECPNNLCCSAGGLCGLGNAYCGAGCQSGACQLTSCGTDRPCHNNQCCKNEKCGLGSKYCGEGCYSGPCIADQKCSKDNKCPNNFCCNNKGFCGLGDRYCKVDAEVGCQSGPCYNIDDVDDGRSFLGSILDCLLP